MLICVEQMCGISSLDAGTAVARAFAERGAQCAVVPIGLPGSGAAAALADAIDAPLSPVVVTDGGSAEGAVAGDTALLAVVASEASDRFAAGSGLVGTALDALLAAHPSVRDIYLDVTGGGWHDGGAGLLSALGARADVTLDAGVDGLRGITAIDLSPAVARLGGRRITLVAATEDAGSPLTGLRGITSRLGGRDDLPLERQLEIDQALQDLADACRRAGGPASGISRGGSSHGGLGFAVLTLGGRVQRGLDVCSGLTGLSASVAQADLVVTGCDELDFGHWDKTAVIEIAAEVGAAVPVIAVARENHITARELRSQLIESAHSLQVAPASDPLGADRARVMSQITEAASGIARSWFPDRSDPAARRTASGD